MAQEYLATLLLDIAHNYVPKLPFGEIGSSEYKLRKTIVNLLKNQKDIQK